MSAFDVIALIIVIWFCFQGQVAEWWRARNEGFAVRCFLQVIPVFAYKWLARKYCLRMTVKGIEFAVIDDTLVRAES